MTGVDQFEQLLREWRTAALILSAAEHALKNTETIRRDEKDRLRDRAELARIEEQTARFRVEYAINHGHYSRAEAA